MCGLVGYIETKDSANCSYDINNAIASLEHRGPDAFGKDEFFTNKKVFEEDRKRREKIKELKNIKKAIKKEALNNEPEFLSDVSKEGWLVDKENIWYKRYFHRESKKGFIVEQTGKLIPNNPPLFSNPFQNKNGNPAPDWTSDNDVGNIDPNTVATQWNSNWGTKNISDSDVSNADNKDFEFSTVRPKLPVMGDKLKNALKRKANYLAFGAFYSSKTKKTKYKANFKILKKIKEITKIPVVAIGGINSNNYKKLLLNKANFLAISSYIWKNKKLKPFDAIQKLK